MLILLTALLPGNSRWNPDPRHLAISCAVLPFIVAYAYCVAKLTEFRTPAIRDWAMRTFMKSERLVTKTAA
jgi:hypothetical protein